MKKTFILLLLIACVTSVYGQKFAVKSNMLYDATSTINLGMEVGLAPKWSLDVSGNYNGWKFGNDKYLPNGTIDYATRLKHWGVQPELRYWFCEAFNGTFLGLHGHYADFNVSDIPFPGNSKFHRYQGDLYGAGLSLGHQWIMSKRWSLEAVIGAGWAYLDYDNCKNCGSKPENDNYFGVTKAAVSIIYFLK